MESGLSQEPKTSDALVALICGEATCDVGCGSGQERKRLCVRLAKKIAGEEIAGDRRSLPSWEVWANAPESVKAETARVMADLWKCPVSFARHHIDVDRENDRLRAALKGAFKVARPWIDGGVTFEEWSASVDRIDAALKEMDRVLKTP